MGGSAVCDFLGCGEEGTIVSRLSPEGFLVATGKKAYSFREAYRRFHYCGNHHDELMGGVWSRVRKPEDKKEELVNFTISGYKNILLLRLKN